MDQSSIQSLAFVFWSAIFAIDKSSGLLVNEDNSSSGRSAQACSLSDRDGKDERHSGG